jgi:hypothetical protein
MANTGMNGNLEGNQETRRGSLTVLLIGAVAMVLLIGLLYWVGRYAPAPAQPPELPLTMGPAENEYVSHIEFLEPQVSRATNFLNQEATFVFGTIKNNGPRSIRQIEITLEFHDVFQQVVLRDKERLFSPDAIPLEPYHMRDFQITYETLPAQWNQGYPTLSITGLALQ